MKYQHFTIEKNRIEEYKALCERAGKKYKFTDIVTGEKTIIQENGKTLIVPVLSEDEVNLRIQVAEYEKFEGIELEKNTAEYYTQKTIRRLLKSTKTIATDKNGDIINKNIILEEMKTIKENPQMLPLLQKIDENTFILYIDYITPTATRASNGYIDSKSVEMAKMVYTIKKGDEIENFKVFLNIL